MFHGGVPGPQRKGLVDRFRDEPHCRLFLATDAGGVGLNLQHASVVVNMDMPWNPAVLEQRIGRVHRLGQRQPVRVVNFVAQGTIEEGMLSLLKFKKSLFAGVLDGGEKEVFLGGSRLNRFMETVEKTTTAIPSALVEEPRDGQAAAEPADGEPAAVEAVTTPAVAASSSGAADPWAGLLQTGVALLQQITAATRPGATPDRAGKPGGAGLTFVARDERTGESYLKLPVPKPEVLEQALRAFSVFWKTSESDFLLGRDVRSSCIPHT